VLEDANLAGGWGTLTSFCETYALPPNETKKIEGGLVTLEEKELLQDFFLDFPGLHILKNRPPGAHSAEFALELEGHPIPDEDLDFLSGIQRNTAWLIFMN